MAGGGGEPVGGELAAAGVEKVRKTIVEKAQNVLAAREIKPPNPPAKVPKLLHSQVPTVPSANGKINMSGRQQWATINGGGNPRWTSFVTAGSIVFETFYTKPLSRQAVNEYKGVVFKYTDGEEYTFPEYHAEVLAMFKADGVAEHLGLDESEILKRCRIAVMRCNNPQTGIYENGGLKEQSDAKRQKRAEDAEAWNAGTALPVQIARLQREIADGQKKNDCLAVARCVAAHDYVEDTEWAALEPMLISATCTMLVQRGISDAQVQLRIQRCQALGMTWSFMSVSDVEVTVTRVLSATTFAGASLPALLLELRATCAFYIGFGCQQGYNREQEHFRQLIEERRSEDGKVVSQPALRKMDDSLLDESDLDALNFQVCILHEDLLAVNARMIETALHRNLFHGPVNKNRLFSHCGGGSYFNSPEVIERHEITRQRRQGERSVPDLRSYRRPQRKSANQPAASAKVVDWKDCALCKLLTLLE